MPTVISVTLLCIVVLVGLFRLRLAAHWLLMATLVAPNISLTSTTVRIELLLVPILVLLTLIRRPKLVMPWPIWLILAFWLWLILVTGGSALYGAQGTLAMTTMYGVTRLGLISLLYANVRFTYEQTMALLRFFVHMAIPLGILAIGQVGGIDLATSLTIDNYRSSTRDAIGSLLASSGFITRGVSIFEVPAFSATYFLLALGTGVWLYLHQSRDRRNVRRLGLAIGCVFAFLGGLTTLSSTFVAGVGVLLVWLSFRLKWKLKFRLVLTTVGVGFLLLPLSLLVLSSNPVAYGSMEYQWNRLVSGEVFETRFNREYGLLASSVDAIGKRPVTGWGYWIQEGVFLGDSNYVVWLYFGGIVGIGLFAYLVAGVTFVATRVGQPGEILLLWVVLLLATSAGSPSFLIPRLADWWWALVGIAAAGYSSWKRAGVLP